MVTGDVVRHHLTLYQGDLLQLHCMLPEQLSQCIWYLGERTVYHNYQSQVLINYANKLEPVGNMKDGMCAVQATADLTLNGLWKCSMISAATTTATSGDAEEITNVTVLGTI